MKIVFIFTTFLISGPVSCFNVIGYPGVINRKLSLHDSGLYQCGETGVWKLEVNLTVETDPCCLRLNTVSGNLGETVTISCSYPEEFERNTKVLFKLDGLLFTDLIHTTESRIGRFSISEDRRSKVLSVRISDVREDDGGVYYCGVWTGGPSVSYYSLYTETQLQVTGSSDITILLIISACVCVALLLIGGSALVYKLRYSGFTSRRSGTNDETDGHYENDQPTNQENIHMGPVYQNLKPNTNQPDSVYQSLIPNTNQWLSVYQSLKPNTNLPGFFVLIVITVCVCVALLLIGGLTLTFCKLRCKKTQKHHLANVNTAKRKRDVAVAAVMRSNKTEERGQCAHCLAVFTLTANRKGCRFGRSCVEGRRAAGDHHSFPGSERKVVVS
ncbi:hypothetical protein AOLI_G00233620 [Acnodon oligacanthus]